MRMSNINRQFRKGLVGRESQWSVHPARRRVVRIRAHPNTSEQLYRLPNAPFESF
jgi:hypothetical protein